MLPDWFILIQKSPSAEQVGSTSATYNSPPFEAQLPLHKFILSPDSIFVNKVSSQTGSI